MTQARCWCGTLNSVEAGFNGQQWLEQKKDKIKYGIGQLEQGHETEHWHFQFYIQLHRSQRLNWLKQNIDSQAHTLSLHVVLPNRTRHTARRRTLVSTAHGR